MKTKTNNAPKAKRTVSIGALIHTVVYTSIIVAAIVAPLAMNYQHRIDAEKHQAVEAAVATSKASR